LSRLKWVARFAEFAIAGCSILGILLFGATIGTIMRGLSGLQCGNSRVKQYEDAIERGELLVMVDIPKERIDAMSKLIIKHHPEDFQKLNFQFTSR
jgi:hypothetical protein